MRLLAVEYPLSRPGLDDHHRDVVRDHVMQLARDPAALDHHRRLRLQLALPGELKVGLL